MTIDFMINLYNKFSAAHIYLVGFEFSGSIWYVMLNFVELMDLLKGDRCSSKRGGWAKIRVRLTKDQKYVFVNSGRATKLGGTEILNDESKYNKGEQFEKVITETLTEETWQKDSIPFTVAGDITLNGEQVQIKFDGAELTNEKTLGRLMTA